MKGKLPVKSAGFYCSFPSGPAGLLILSIWLLCLAPQSAVQQVSTKRPDNLCLISILIPVECTMCLFFSLPSDTKFSSSSSSCCDKDQLSKLGSKISLKKKSNGKKMQFVLAWKRNLSSSKCSETVLRRLVAASREDKGNSSSVVWCADLETTAMQSCQGLLRVRAEPNLDTKIGS